MLQRLRVRDLALGGELDLELAAGLTAVSGETGAGKSVLVEALGLLVGERADAAAIRPGAERAVVEGVFRLGDAQLRSAVGALVGETAEELSLRREVVREGPNRCYVNGRAAPAVLLRDIGDLLVELHGQHEHQRLLRSAVQRELLDAFAGLDAERRALEEETRAWRADARRLDEARARAREREERMRRLREEVEEIAAADLSPEADARRREEADRLRSVEDRRERAARALARLDGDEASVLELLRAARPDLLALADEEPRLAKAGARFADAAEALADVARDLERYRDGLTGDPERLAELDRREAELLRLRRRYATDLEGLLVREGAARAELDALGREADEAADLERAVAGAGARRLERARRLSAGRARAARELAGEVAANLRDLGLGGGAFEARLEPLPEPEAAGLERVEFRIAPNPGEPAGALASIASGGELSRVVLALKAALARADRVPTLVFDEIDAGVGGRLARRVAEKLLRISRERQVLVVTHLAVVAASADVHLRVEKLLALGRTRIRVTPVTGEARVEELSRMLGGEPESEVSRRHARELLRGGAGERRRGARPRGRAAAAPRTPRGG